MKNEKNHKGNGNGSSQQKVRFQFANPSAISVAVAGTFNEWRPSTTPMVPMGNGLWVKEVLLSPGAYEYRLVVDDEWISDPLCPDSVPNPFGGMNSVLKVPPPATRNGSRP